MRSLVPLLLAVLSGAAEVARNDLQLAVESADGGYDYTLNTPVGSFTGSDAFDRFSTLRLGGRWAWSGIGSSLGLLAGGDLLYTDATLADGSLTGWGAELDVGGTWAVHDRWCLDAEAFGGYQMVSLDMQSAGAQLTGDGGMLRNGLRLRLLWHASNHWSIGTEAGWQAWHSALTVTGDRDLTMDGSGLQWGLVLAWRPSVRPAGIE